MYIHIYIDTVETGLPGLKYPTPEDSGVYVYRYTVEFTWFEVSGTGGIRSTGARGNKFTWFEVSGTGGFRCM